MATIDLSGGALGVLSGNAIGGAFGTQLGSGFNGPRLPPAGRITCTTDHEFRGWNLTFFGADGKMIKEHLIDEREVSAQRMLSFPMMKAQAERDDAMQNLYSSRSTIADLRKEIKSLHAQNIDRMKDILEAEEMLNRAQPIDWRKRGITAIWAAVGACWLYGVWTILRLAIVGLPS